VKSFETENRFNLFDFNFMASNNNETLLFIVEWYDPMPQLKKTYLLRYFIDQHMVEMVDVKNKKVFLKKSSCPKEITSNEFIVGGKITLYSRELEIVDYGDLKTKEKLNYQLQQCLVILPPQTYNDWGNIITELSKEMLVFKVKSVIITQSTASTVVQVLEENSKKSNFLQNGANLVIIFNATNAYDKLKNVSDTILIPKFGEFLYTKNNQQTSTLQQLFFVENYNNSATLDSCTCCIIKPHAVKAKLFGNILNLVIKQGYNDIYDYLNFKYVYLYKSYFNKTLFYLLYN
jgi:nucleoside-diphosphate kinase